MEMVIVIPLTQSLCFDTLFCELDDSHSWPRPHLNSFLRADAHCSQFTCATVHYDIRMQFSSTLHCICISLDDHKNALKNKIPHMRLDPHKKRATISSYLSRSAEVWGEKIKLNGIFLQMIINQWKMVSFVTAQYQNSYTYSRSKEPNAGDKVAEYDK